MNIPGTVSSMYSASGDELDAQFCGAVLQPTPTEALPIESPTAAAQGSLLTGRVTMCDTGGNLIGFRITQPPPDLTGKILTAQIGGQENACYVNATNPSLMTCTLPPGMVFPAPAVVSIDGAVASEFTYSGLGCAEITTPIATTTP